jgi:hypothetical protein
VTVVLSPPSPSTSQESLVLIDLELNDGVIYGLKEIHMPPPTKRQEWVTGGDQSGGLLPRDPLFDNRQITGVVEIAADSRDAASEYARAISERLEEAEKHGDDGVPLIRTAPGTTSSKTFYVLSGTIGDVPMTMESGYYATTPLIEVPFTFDCKPFAYGDWIDTVLDSFTTDTLANYTFTAGAGTMQITGGDLLPTNTATKRFYYNVPGFRAADMKFTVHYSTGDSLVGGADIRIGKRIDNNNRITVVRGPTDMSIFKTIGGVTSSLANVGIGTYAANTDYWLVFRITGNVVTGEFWTSAPTVGGTPTGTLSFTLLTTDAALFGKGQLGDFVFQQSPNDTDWQFHDFEMTPHVARNSEPGVTLIVPGVAGDVPAEGRLTVTDRANKVRRWTEYGIQSRYTDLTQPLFIDSSSFVLTGFNGITNTSSGMYGSNVVQAGAGSGIVPIAIAGLGDQGHVGVYRVKARVINVDYLRLAWKVGDGPLMRNAWAVSNQADRMWHELDLGTIEIPEARYGAQRWTGQLEVFVGGANEIDYVQLIPVGEGYGKARSPITFQVINSFLFLDQFGTGGGGTLGTTAGWTALGSTDFATNTTLQVAESSLGVNTFRLDQSGAAITSDVLVQVDQMTDSLNSTRMGVAVRIVDTANYLLVRVAANAQQLVVEKVVGGVDTTILQEDVAGPVINAYYTLRAQVDSDGRVAVWYYPKGYSPGNPYVAADSDLATGGPLATGRCGLAESNTSGGTRYYDYFLVSLPSTDAVMYPRERVEFRWDGTYRYDASGTYQGPVPERRGGDLYVPEAGSEGRTARVYVRAARNDLEEYEDSPYGDDTQVQLAYRPRYLLAD